LEIRVENLNYHFSYGTPFERHALKNISFTVPSGKVLGILGPIGSGKTTLARNLNGLASPTSGSVFINNVDIGSMGDGLRKKVALVFQQPEKQLFEESVFADIAFPLVNSADFEEEEVDYQVRQACATVGLDIDAIGDRNPFDLSSGEKRRVAIAGALVNNPDILILDEPAANLDPPSLLALNRIVDSFRKNGARTVIIVSHDMDCFLTLLDLLAVMKAGEMVAFGSVSEVCARLRDHHDLRAILPSIGMLVEELKARNIPIPNDNFDLQLIKKAIMDILSAERSLT
jgi:energy-coupling factor transport system ATP-binding protein